MIERAREDQGFLYTDLVKNARRQSAHLTLLDEVAP